MQEGLRFGAGELGQHVTLGLGDGGDGRLQQVPARFGENDDARPAVVGVDGAFHQAFLAEPVDDAAVRAAVEEAGYQLA